MYVVNTDCSIEPFNPGGILAWGFIVRDRIKKSVICERAGIGGRGKWTTNNIGEYQAVIAAMLWLITELPESERRNVIIQSDSQLIVNQCSGKWQCRDEKLKPLHEIVMEAKDRYGKSITFKWIPRKRNVEADALSRTAYDQQELQLLKEGSIDDLFGEDNIPW